MVEGCGLDASSIGQGPVGALMNMAMKLQVP
jgi:hypothetical protein